VFGGSEAESLEVEHVALARRLRERAPGAVGGEEVEIAVHDHGVVVVVDPEGHGVPAAGPHGRVPGAQVADFFHLQEVEKCIAIRSGEQASLLPGSQLPGGNAQNSEKVFSTVSIHV